MKVIVRVKGEEKFNARAFTPLPVVHVVHVHTNWPVAPAQWRPMQAYPTEFICSECGELWPDEKTRFCPHCGAKMR